jgi:hypothetical protein
MCYPTSVDPCWTRLSIQHKIPRKFEFTQLIPTRLHP